MVATGGRESKREELRRSTGDKVEFQAPKWYSGMHIDGPHQHREQYTESNTQRTVEAKAESESERVRARERGRDT